MAAGSTSRGGGEAHATLPAAAAARCRRRAMVTMPHDRLLLVMTMISGGAAAGPTPPPPPPLQGPVAGVWPWTAVEETVARTYRAVNDLGAGGGGARVAVHDSGESWQWLAQVGSVASDAGGYSSLSVINSSHVGVAWEGSSHLSNGTSKSGLFFAAAEATTTDRLKTDDNTPAATVSPDCSSAGLKNLPYCDPTAAADQRIADLLSRMNSTQKVARLVEDPAPQLSGEAAGVPLYVWGVEGQVMSFDTCLSSVGCDDPTNPLCYVCGVTFPMPPALGASFNTTLIEEIGSLVGDSVRALDNWNRNRSTHSTPPTPTQRALSVRGPYVNIMRDPRDGRNQERPSEDPWWCGEVGAAWIHGVQDGVHSPWQVRVQSMR